MKDSELKKRAVTLQLLDGLSSGDVLLNNTSQ